MWVTLMTIPEFTRNTHSASGWLEGMAKAASHHEIGIQYCMGLPAFALESLRLSSVTNFRASDDNDPWANYGVSPERWRIGL